MSPLQIVPQPPVDMVMPQPRQTVFTVLVHVPFVILLFLAVRLFPRERNLAPSLFAFGFPLWWPPTGAPGERAERVATAV